MPNAVCPNDPSHDRFETVAEVIEFWVVDAEGKFIKKKSYTGAVSSYPNSSNTWTCDICGCEAVL